MPSTNEPRPGVSQPLPAGSVLETILGAAESAIGTMYQWGGNSLATGVDCSGLIQQAFLAGGIRLPRVSASQMRVGQPVGSLAEAVPGDLIGYQTGDRNGSGVEHIAIYIGNGMQIEAYRTGAPVRVSQVRPGATFRRVIGHIDAGTPGKVTLGGNTDRSYTTAAVGRAEAPPPQVAAQTVTAPPEGGVGDDLPPNATPEQIEDYIRDHLPDLYLYWQNPEIRKVLTDAATNDWGDAELQGALRETNYWKSHGPASRALDALLASDRKGAEQVINGAKSIVSDLFTRNGMKFTDKEIGEFAKGALRQGIIGFSNGQVYVANQDQLNKVAAFGLGTQVGKLPAGETAFTADGLMAMARREYMLPITRREADRWAVEMLAGGQTEESIRAELNRRARDRYRYLNLAEGQKVSDITDSVVAVVADRLELDPDSIDLLDPRWNRLLEHTDEKGVKRAMTLGEADEWARRRPEYAGTREYKATEASYGLGAAKFVGAAA